MQPPQYGRSGCGITALIALAIREANWAGSPRKNRWRRDGIKTRPSSSGLRLSRANVASANRTSVARSAAWEATAGKSDLARSENSVAFPEILAMSSSSGPQPESRSKR